MSTESMTSKERTLAAMAGILPDRVPVQLGITNMFSVYRQNLSGWDVYAHGRAPMWKVSLDTQRSYGLDCYMYVRLTEKEPAPGVTVTTRDVHRDEERIIRRTDIETPEGTLFSQSTFLRNESPTTTTGLIKSERDFELWLKYCVRDDADYDRDELCEQIRAMGDDGVVAGEVGVPGLAHLSGLFEGKLEKASYFAYDYPEYIEAYREKFERAMMRKLAFTLESGVDYVQIGQSGMLTLSTPDFFHRLCLPSIEKMTALCRQAGVLTEIHACGKERLIVEACYDHTGLSSINPLQPPPMGDVDLAEMKEKFGDRLCLKGNVGVTFPLLFGTPDDVERDVVRCMDAAKQGGRYILFSEEGIGALTPAENVRRYVQAGWEYGRY